MEKTNNYDGTIFEYQADYARKVRERQKRQQEQQAQENGAQEAQNAAPVKGQAAGEDGGASGMQVSQGTSTIDTLGNAGMASGNPYLMAAGLGMKVYAQGEANKRKQEEMQRQAYNERIKRRQQILTNIAQSGIR